MPESAAWTLYILYSPGLDKYYIGISQDVERRVRQHNQPNRKGWTARGRPWELVFTQSFPDRLTATRAERELKRRRSRWLIEKIVAGERSLPEPRRK